MKPPYPLGLDFSWVACDASGRLGAFVTAGQGPVPIEAFAAGEEAVLDSEASVLALPVVSDASLTDVDSFRALAERGFYVFDWTDVHRTDGLIRAYEMVARPITPRVSLDLSPDLGWHLPLVILPCDFSADERIAVATMVPSVAPAGY